MAEYIDIDKKIVVIDTRGRKCETTVRHVLDFNKVAYETTDVATVRHGRWETDTCHVYCSVCDKYVDEKTDFCPNCGADMREYDS